jgi:molybdopterin synthase catalytic subunit
MRKRGAEHGDELDDRLTMTEMTTVLATTLSGAEDAVQPLVDVVEVSQAPLDVQRVVDAVAHASAGAISSFVGTTRDHFQGKRVLRLEYEGYEPMAASELRKICAQVRQQWPGVVRLALVHRLGVVPVKEASVVVAVSSPHRRDAIEACAFAIDELKASVPIWKSEQYEGDERVWKENAEWRGAREPSLRSAAASSSSSCCHAKRAMEPAA